MKPHRLKRQDRFANLVHRFDVEFETPGRHGGAQFTAGIDCYLDCGAGVDKLVEDAADIASRSPLAVRQVVADADRVVFPGNADHEPTDTNVGIAGNLVAGCETDGGILGARTVASHSGKSDGSITAAADVKRERSATDRRVIMAV